MPDAFFSRIESLYAAHSHANDAVIGAHRSKNLLKNVPKKSSTFTLMALTLAACGGGGTSGTEGSTESEVLTDNNGATSNLSNKAGHLLKGPVEGAFVFADYDGDGVWDEGLEPFARTDINGAYLLESVDEEKPYELVALLAEAVDNSNGNTFRSGSLKAPANAEVITPFTTLMAEQKLTAQQVVEVLGLGDIENFDPLTFNPYDASVDAATALAVEKSAHKLMAVVQAVSVILSNLAKMQISH